MYWDDEEPVDEQKKWTEWTMNPKKPKAPLKMTDYVSGIVFMTSGVYVMGFMM